jgi:hypothetical protein
MRRLKLAELTSGVGALVENGERVDRQEQRREWDRDGVDANGAHE